MRRLSTREVATYVVDELDHGVAPKLLSKQVAALLIAENRVIDALKLARAIEMELTRRGVTQIKITSALKLDVTTKKHLAEALGVKRPAFYEVIDESVLGGARAETAELQLDMTLRRKLMLFKERARVASNG